MTRSEISLIFLAFLLLCVSAALPEISTSVGYSGSLQSALFTSACSNTSLAVWQDDSGIQYAVLDENAPTWQTGTLVFTSTCGVHLAPLEQVDVVMLTTCSNAVITTHYYRISSLRDDISIKANVNCAIPSESYIRPSIPCTQVQSVPGLTPSPSSFVAPAFTTNRSARVMYCGLFDKLGSTNPEVYCVSWLAFNSIDSAIKVSFDTFQVEMGSGSFPVTALHHYDGRWELHIASTFQSHSYAVVDIISSTATVIDGSIPPSSPYNDIIFANYWNHLEKMIVQDVPYRTALCVNGASLAIPEYTVQAFNITAKISMRPETEYVLSEDSEIIDCLVSTSWYDKTIIQHVTKGTFSLYIVYSKTAVEDLVINGSADTYLAAIGAIEPGYFCPSISAVTASPSSRTPIGTEMLVPIGGSYATEVVDIAFINYPLFLSDRSFSVGGGTVVLNHILETSQKFITSGTSTVISSGGFVRASHADLGGTLVINSQSTPEPYTIIYYTTYSGNFSSVVGCGNISYTDTGVVVDESQCLAPASGSASPGNASSGNAANDTPRGLSMLVGLAITAYLVNM